MPVCTSGLFSNARLVACQFDFCLAAGAHERHGLHSCRIGRPRIPRRQYNSGSSKRWANFKEGLAEKYRITTYIILQADRPRLLENVMKLIFRKRLIKRILLGTTIICLIIFIIIFLIIPLVYKNSYAFQRNLLFLNFVSMPVNFKDPKSVGLTGARNFYITTDDNVTLGVWQLLPASKLSLLKLNFYTESDFESALGSGAPIFLYMHGNSGNRGSGHRVELYKKLQKCNYNVIAFDYRSYGDSSRTEPSEAAVVADSKAVYKWIKSHAKNSKIFFWGHSLGTGISSHLLDELESEGTYITGLVLEAPFNNMVEEVRSYPMAKIFSYLPWFDYFFTEPMYENGLKFESDKHLVRVKAPILILHAEDDVVIPISLGYKLYKTVRDARKDRSPITFIKFDKNLHFGHKFIYKDPELDKKVMKFVEESSAFKSF